MEQVVVMENLFFEVRFDTSESVTTIYREISQIFLILRGVVGLVMLNYWRRMARRLMISILYDVQHS